MVGSDVSIMGSDSEGSPNDDSKLCKAPVAVGEKAESVSCAAKMASSCSGVYVSSSNDARYGSMIP